MAITYNSNDNVFYGTNAERLADTKIVKQKTAKFFEYDTQNVYISDGTNWTIL